MQKKSLVLMYWPLLFSIAIFLLLPGCGAHRSLVSQRNATLRGTEKIAIVGFRPALSERERPHTVRDPLSGAVFQAEPVPSRVAREMTQELFDRLRSRGSHDLMPPGQALGVYANLASRDMRLALLPAKLLQEIGKVLGADLVLAGYIYRWRERQGTDYAANRPASVAFDLHLVKSSDGTTIWTGKFDKTQHSLSENILDLKTFLGGKGRWMTARGLASLGLDQLLAEMP